MKKHEVGDLVKFRVGTTVWLNSQFLDSPPIDLEGEYGILIENVSSSQKRPNSRWKIYIQSLGEERIFETNKFSKLPQYEGMKEENKMDDNSVNGTDWLIGSQSGISTDGIIAVDGETNR